MYFNIFKNIENQGKKKEKKCLHIMSTKEQKKSLVKWMSFVALISSTYMIYILYEKHKKQKNKKIKKERFKRERSKYQLYVDTINDEAKQNNIMQAFNQNWDIKSVKNKPKTAQERWNFAAKSILKKKKISEHWREASLNTKESKIVSKIIEEFNGDDTLLQYLHKNVNQWGFDSIQFGYFICIYCL